MQAFDVLQSQQQRRDERVLLLARSPRDALRYEGMLEEAGIGFTICGDPDELRREVEAGAGAVLLVDDDLVWPDLDKLDAILARQPRWSDLPVIALAAGGRDRERGSTPPEGVLLLEQPVRPAVLVSALRSALHTRRKQYQFRNELLDRERVEEVLRHSEELLRTIERAGGVGVFEWDLLANRVAWTEQLEAIYGLAPGTFECTPEAWSKRVHPEDLPGVRKLLEECLRDQRRELEEQYRIIRADGTIRWVSTRATVTYDASMRPVRMVGASADITEQRHVEVDRRESEEKFRLLAERSRVIIGILRDRRLIYVNPYLIEVSGYTREELLSMDVAELIHPDDRERVLDYARRRLMGEASPLTYEYRLLTKTGRVRWLEISPVRIDYQGAPAITGTARDITERKQAEEALRYSEARFRAFFEMAVVGAVELDPETKRFVRVNERFCEMTGYSRSELLGMTLADLTHPEDRPRAVDLFERVLSGDLPDYVIEKRSVRKDGQVVWVHVSVAILRDERGKSIRATGIVHDITGRKRIEETLRSRTKGLKLLSDTATTLLRTEHPEEVLQQIFDELAGSLGVELCVNYAVAPELGGIRLNITSGIDDATRRQLAFLKFGEGVCGTVAQSGERIVAEDVLHSIDPKTDLLRELQITAYACFPISVHSKVVATLAFGTRKRASFTGDELNLMRAVADQVALALERQHLLDELKRRAEELAGANRAKDNFLAVLSHELRTPLTPVLIEASSLHEDPLFPEFYRDRLGIIRRNIELEARLIDDLLDITRIARGKLQLAFQPVNIAAVLRETVQICAPDARAKGLGLKVETRRDCCNVFGDSARLQQVFWNLVKNAIKFTPEGGLITVRCRPRHAKPRDRAVITVSDTGPGIDPELLPRLFNAFEQGGICTTRQFGGLGLGLAICKALVEMHSGTIAASSGGPGQGATFTVELPLMPAQAPAPIPADRVRVRQRSERAEGLRILFVEDHPDTAFVIAELLRRRGHAVRTAGSVRSALEVAAQEEFDLVISDLGLPDGSGMDVMRRLKEGHPKLAGIALTGYGTDEDVEKSREAGFDEHLVKPVDFAELFQTVARLGAGH